MLALGQQKLMPCCSSLDIWKMMAPLILWSALVIVVYGAAYSLISTGASRLSDVNVNGRVLWQSECLELSYRAGYSTGAPWHCFSGCSVA